MTKRYDPDEAREFFADWLVREEGDETRAYCPLCEDVAASNSPSASFNFGDNKWNCLKGEHGGSVAKLWSDLGDGVVVSIRTAPSQRETEPKPGPTEAQVEAWHENLMAQPDQLEAIEELRGWSADTIKEFMIGLHRGRYTIPIYDANGELVNIRQYKPNPGDQQKFINIKGHGKNRLWGFDTLQSNEWVLLCAGEPDRILAIQEGFPAVTWTGGESNFQAEWGSHFQGKIVKICLDADDAGREGAQKVVEALQHYAAELYLVELPEKIKGYDVTDVILQEGPHQLQLMIDSAVQLQLPDTNPITETDHGNALRLIDAYSDRFRHVADMKRWHFWDNTRWAMDVNDREIRGAHINLAHEQLPDGGFKRNALSRYGIVAAVTVAEVDRRISILADQLDSHGDLLNTPSGIVHLRNGDLRPFDPDLLLTRSTAYAADLEAPHPKWDAFLEQTFEGSENLIAYLQQLFGLALVGSAPEHVLPFLHGQGRNGKGVITLVLQGLLGNADSGGYSLTAPEGFLMSGRDSAHPTEVARIRGARLVVCSEQSSSKRFDEQRVKKFSGGDRLAGRFMHGNLFEFNPTHLLWVMSNRLPAVREGGPAFWERVKMIPFYNVVPPEKRILEFDQLLLAAEGPAILGWAVHGAVDVLNNGLSHPAEVVKATEDYKIAEDALASFLQEECQLGPDGKVNVGDFAQRLKEHCEAMDAEPISSRDLKARLTSEYPIEYKRNGQGRFYKGVTLSGKLSMSNDS